MGAGVGPCPLEQRERVGTAERGADTSAVIVAGGSGERFGDPRGKQFVELCGLPLMAWSIIAFDHAPSVGQMVIVCAPDRVGEVQQDVLARLTLKKDVTIAPSGSTRQESVASGLRSVEHGMEFVAVHDAARPLVETEDIERVIACVRQDPSLAGAILAAPAIDTLKLVEDGTIIATPDRSFYWAAQTPQVFRTRAIVSAYKAAAWEGYVGTDDSSLVEHHGGRVRCVAGSRDNIKVTIPFDLAVAEVALEQRILASGPEGDAPEGER